MRKQDVAAALIACFCFGGDVVAADVSSGEKIYKKVCRTCHGPTGKGMASFPKLAGHEAGYVAMRLEQYRSGEKLGPNTPLMAPHAKKLSDDDIQNIEAFINASFN